ncbi:MAG: cyclic nucleotide-binding domain-containing protein [Nitrospira sp.]|nr:cyclic nucleotide-binding domain-containing protein [Nitrospira sp.]
MQRSEPPGSRPDTSALLASVELFRGLDQPTLRKLESEMTPVHVSAGEVLFRRGDPADSLYLVADGSLQVVFKRADDTEQVLGQIGIGGCLGEIALLANQPRSATVRAIMPSELLRLTKAGFDRFLVQHPDIKQQLERLATSRQSGQSLALMDLFRGIDRAALDQVIQDSTWLRLSGGDILFRQGDPADCLYTVVNGRLEAIIQSEGGGDPAVRPIGRGTCVGEMALLTDAPRSATVRAVRDSELIRLSRAAFDRLLHDYPQAAVELSRTLARRLQQSDASRTKTTPIATIAVVPGHQAVPHARFAERLVSALGTCGGSVVHLDSSRLDRHLGEGAAQVPLSALGNNRIVDWLNDQEAQYRYLLLECDSTPSPWTKRCLRQADLILLVHTAAADPVPGAIEMLMRSGEAGGAGARKELVLLHPDDAKAPEGTRQWLKACRVSAHHHVRADRQADYERLARILTGKSVSLVLSGGGARGFAHIGVIRAIKDCGLPIDLIGGTSMGAIIAGQYAMGHSVEEIVEMNRRGFVGLAPHRDKTLPIIAMITGRKLTKMLKMMFGSRQIEDLWIKFFCVSANLTRAEMMVHQDGPLWLWTRASVAVPGAIPPVVLSNGDLLIDGGILNNLPADVMGQLVQGSVIAVDVCARTDLTATVGAHTFFSGWRLFWNRVNPFAKRVALPNIFNILTRATMLNTLSKIETIKRQADLYLHVPTEGISIFDWKSIDRIEDIGYHCAVDAIENWKRSRPT